MNNYKIKRLRLALKYALSQSLTLSAQILKSKSLQFFLVLGTSSSVVQLISVASSPVLTRLYTPEDLGAQSIFTAMLSQLLILACFRYEWAIVLPKSKDDAIALIIACFGLSALTSCSIAVISVIFKQQLLEVLNIDSGMSFLLLLLAPTVFVSGCYQTLNYWNIRQKNFSLVAQTKLVQRLSSTGLQIGLGILSFGSVGLIIGTALNSSVGSGKLAMDFFKREKNNIKAHITWNKIFSNCARYSSFPQISVWSSFLNSAGLNAPVFFLSCFYGIDIVGEFALSQRLISMPFNLVSSSVFQTFLSRISSLNQQDPFKAKKLYVKILLFLIGFSLMVGILFWMGSYHFEKVFGSQWRDAGLITRCLTPSLITSLIVSPISVLDWLGRESWMLTWNASRIACITVIFCLSNFLEVDALITITVFSWFMATMYSILLFLNLKALSLNIKEQSSL